jgi:hypothetical protein
MKVTALIPLPLFYNPDETGTREPVGDEAFERTAEEVARQFGGGMLALSGRASAGILVGLGGHR